jgi:hypothetical protein
VNITMLSKTEEFVSFFSFFFFRLKSFDAPILNANVNTKYNVSQKYLL